MVVMRVDEDFKKWVDTYRKNLQRELGLDIIPSREQATRILGERKIEITIKKRKGSKKLQL